MICYINSNNKVEFNFNGFPHWRPLGYSGIYLSHSIGLLSVDDECKQIDDFVKKYNLHGYPIMFSWSAEGYQHVIIQFINDIVKELVTNYTEYDIDMFHFHNGGLSVDENIGYYNSLPFDYLPNNLWLSNSLMSPYYNQTINREIEINTKSKKILSMNGNPRTTRRLALSYLIKNDLLKDSFYSFDSSKLLGYNYDNHPLLQKYNKIVENLITEDTEPMCLSKKHDDLLSDDRIKTEDIYYFDNSYFSLVQETFYDNTLDWSTGDIGFYECIFITEKTYRPIYFKHPFILLGVKGSLAGLRKYGFKTFSPYFDESYDDIDDPVLRLETALNEVKRLCSLSDDTWLSIQRELLPIVEYNYNLITSTTPTTLRAKRK
jgi:hypothetical protein